MNTPSVRFGQVTHFPGTGGARCRNLANQTIIHQTAAGKTVFRVCILPFSPKDNWETRDIFVISDASGPKDKDAERFQAILKKAKRFSDPLLLGCFDADMTLNLGLIQDLARNWQEKNAPDKPAAFIFTGYNHAKWALSRLVVSADEATPVTQKLDQCFILTGRQLEQFKNLLQKASFVMEPGRHFLAERPTVLN